MTPMQRFVYTLAKDHHTDDYSSDVSDMRKAQGATSGF